MGVKKIKMNNPKRRGNTKPKTAKQIEASKKNGSLVMLTNNPMKNPEVAKNNLRIRKERGTLKNKPFAKGNQLGRLNKNNPNQIQAGRLSGIMNTGRKHSEEHNKKISEGLKRNNPMKNPEVVKRHPALFKKGNQLSKGLLPWNTGKTGIKTSNKGHKSWNKGLTKEDPRIKKIIDNPNVKKNWFKKKEKEVQNENISINDPIAN